MGKLAPDIIVKRKRALHEREYQQYSERVRLGFERRATHVTGRLSLDMFIVGTPTYRPVMRPYNVQFTSTAAIRYFQSRLAELMREVDGVVVVEDEASDAPR